MTRLGSPLAAVAASAGPPRDGRDVARGAWLRDGIVMLRPGWISDHADRAALLRIAEQVHGERRG